MSAPDVQGDLRAYPIPRLLFLLLRRAFVGRLDVQRPDQGTSQFFFRDGLPTYTDLPSMEDVLGQVLLERGFIDQQQHIESLTELANGGKLHGQILLAMGAIDQRQLIDALSLQLRRKLNRLFAYPEQLQFALYGGDHPHGTVKEAAHVRADPLFVIYNGVRNAFSGERLVAALQPLESATLQTRPDLAKIQRRFGFAEEEQGLLSVLAQGPSPLAKLLQISNTSETQTRMLIYTLWVCEALEVARPTQQAIQPTLSQPAIQPTLNQPGAGAPASRPATQARASQPVIQPSATQASLEATGPRAAMRASLEATGPQAAMRASLEATGPQAAMRGSSPGIRARGSSPGIHSRGSSPAIGRGSSPGIPQERSPTGDALPSVAALADSIGGGSHPAGEDDDLTIDLDALRKVTEEVTIDSTSQLRSDTGEAPALGTMAGALLDEPADDAPAIITAGPPPKTFNNPAVSPQIPVQKAKPQRAKKRPTIGALQQTKLVEKKWQSIQEQDHFQVLEIDRKASPNAIRDAFLKLAKTFHPDKLSGVVDPKVSSKADEVFRRLNEANTVLGDAKDRQAYLDRLESGVTEEQEQAAVRSALEAEFAFQKGMVHYRKRAYRFALDEFKTAFEMAPEEAEHKAWYAWTLFCDPRSDKDEVLVEVKQLLIEAIKDQPKNAPCHYFLGEIHLYGSDEKRALASFNKALEINPDHLEAQRQVRIINMRKERTKKNERTGLFGLRRKK